MSEIFILAKKILTRKRRVKCIELKIILKSEDPEELVIEALKHKSLTKYIIVNEKRIDESDCTETPDIFFEKIDSDYVIHSKNYDFSEAIKKYNILIKMRKKHVYKLYSNYHSRIVWHTKWTMIKDLITREW